MDKFKISATIVADSVSNKGKRITSYILTYPRMIHAEVMTHRMFSRNAASSRAIPFEKMLKTVQEDPFIPIAWQKDHKGMQGVEYYTDPLNIKAKQEEWLIARNHAINQAKQLSSMGITKQLCNRLLEPFLWYTCLVTATEYDNFFELRCPKYPGSVETYRSKKDVINSMVETEGFDSNYFNNLSELDWIKKSTSGAEIHIQALAEAMWDARNESTPKQLQPGEWHIPFGDNIKIPFGFSSYHSEEKYKIKIATARAARLSYMTFDGEIDYEKDIALHDTLLKSRHMSPFEHVAKCMSEPEYNAFAKGCGTYANMSSSLYFEEDSTGWCNNFKGFIPYRYLIEKNNNEIE